MNLRTFLDMLIEVELSQHVFGSLNIDESLVKQLELINLINRGLEQLHMRFIIKKGELAISVNNSSKYRYDIKDENLILSPDNVQTIIKVLEVWDSCGNPIGIDTLHRSKGYCVDKEESVQRVNQTTLMFNNCCGCYHIIYQQGPTLIKKPIEGEEFSPELVELDIPMEFIDALIYYVSSRLFSINPPMDGNAAAYSSGIVYTKRYEEELARLRDLNLEIDGVGDTLQRFNASRFP